MSDRRTRRTQQERVDESNRRLATAAVDLIAEKGYAQTTAKEIGLRAGYSRALVAERFGGKEGLLDVLMDEYESRIAVTIPDGATGFELSMAPIDAARRFALEDPKFLRAMFIVNFEAVHDTGSLRDRIREWIVGLRAAVHAAIETGRADGSIATTVNADQLSIDIISEGIGYAYWWIVLDDQFDYISTLLRWRDRVEKALTAQA